MYPTDVLPALAARAGFDAVMLDNEHASWDRREHPTHAVPASRRGHRLPHPPRNRNPPDLYHLLEDGATGFLFQMVNSAEEARALVQAVKFPPLGQRGLSAPAFDNQYTWGDSVEAFMAEANEETVVMVMIETPEAVAHVDEIAAVPGIDALYMGPADLSLRLNCFDRWDDPPMRECTPCGGCRGQEWHHLGPARLECGGHPPVGRCGRTADPAWGRLCRGHRDGRVVMAHLRGAGEPPKAKSQGHRRLHQGFQMWA